MKRTPLLRKTPLRKRRKSKRGEWTKDKLWNAKVAKFCKFNHPVPEGQDPNSPIHQREAKRVRDGLCFTCGSYCAGKNRQAGHYHADAVCGWGLRFHPLGIHIQCGRCNGMGEGEGALYQQRMVEVYGEEIVRQINTIRWKQYKVDLNAASDYFDRDPKLPHPLVLPFVTEV